MKDFRRGILNVRFIRGGSRYYVVQNTRASYRNYNNPGNSYYYTGFRLVLLP